MLNRLHLKRLVFNFCRNRKLQRDDLTLQEASCRKPSGKIPPKLVDLQLEDTSVQEY